MSTFAELITLTRDLFAFPTPATGGTDKLSDTNILRWLNDGFEEMSDAIFGIPADVEFTIEAGTGTNRTVTVTKPDTGVTISENDQDYTYYKVSGVRSYGQFENLTTALRDTSLRIMLKLPPEDPRFQAVMNATSAYLNYYWIDGDRGFVLLPRTLSEENTIHIQYRKNLTRVTDTSESPDSYFTTRDEMYPVYKAVSKLCLQLEDMRQDSFLREAAKEMGKFLQRAHTIDLAPAVQIMGGGVRRVPGRIR
jgi:hypothetical protein